jgi:tetratricopeptide (TPR) repeat protein
MSGAIVLCLFLQAAAQTVFDLGVTQYRERNYGAAIESLGKALKTEAAGSANHTEALLLLGQSYYSLKRFADAIPVLEQRLAVSDRPEARYMLATSYLWTQQFDKARGAFATLFHVPANSPGARLINAQMLVRNDLQIEAERELQTVLKADGAIPGVHLLAGELAMYRGDHNAAVRHLKEELRLNPASSVAHYKLGDAYTRQEDWPEAIAHLQKSVWLNPFYSGPYILLGKAHLKTESLANAEGYLRRAIELDPGNSMAHFLLGQTLIRAGKSEEGKAMLKRFQAMPKDR